AGRRQVLPRHQAPLPPDALLLSDLGSWSLGRWQDLTAASVGWLSRLDPHTHVFDAAGTRLDLPRWLVAQGSPTVEASILLGARARPPVRLLAVRVVPSVAEARRRKLQ